MGRQNSWLPQDILFRMLEILFRMLQPSMAQHLVLEGKIQYAWTIAVAYIGYEDGVSLGQTKGSSII